jgi:calcium homeostasis ER protein
MYSARKNAEDLKKALEEVVVPMFCSTSIGITEDQQTKLNKVLYGLALSLSYLL